MYLGSGMHFRHTAHFGQCGRQHSGSRAWDLHEDDFMADKKLYDHRYSTTIFTERAIDKIMDQPPDKVRTP